MAPAQVVHRGDAPRGHLPRRLPASGLALGLVPVMHMQMSLRSRLPTGCKRRPKRRSTRPRRPTNEQHGLGATRSLRRSRSAAPPQRWICVFDVSCLVFTPCRLESRNRAHTYEAWTRSSCLETRTLLGYPREPTAAQASCRQFWRLRANATDATTYHSEGRSLLAPTSILVVFDGFWRGEIPEESNPRPPAVF